MKRWHPIAAAGVAGLLLFAGWQAIRAQQPAETKPLPAKSDPNRFDFEVIESFDEKYEGDTPGYIGKYGGLEQKRPRVALHDPVYMGEEKVGSVTGVRWSRAFNSLEVEFTAEKDAEICVGDEVWLAMREKKK